MESVEEIARKLEDAGSAPREDINRALGVGQGPRPGGNVEVKYSCPDGVLVDVPETGWVGTRHSPRPSVLERAFPQPLHIPALGQRKGRQTRGNGDDVHGAGGALSAR